MGTCGVSALGSISKAFILRVNVINKKYLYFFAIFIN
jgi:hypothetical protein